MPPTYPGVYIEEQHDNSHVIHGVATAVSAFVGRALRGPVDEPVLVHSFAEFERVFGGLTQAAPISHAVRLFFLNGGAQAWIVRVAQRAPGDVEPAVASILELAGVAGPLGLVAASPGAWGNGIEAFVDYRTNDPNPHLFNLMVREVVDGRIVSEESFRNLSLEETNPGYAPRVLEEQSQLVRVDTSIPDRRPDPSPVVRGERVTQGAKGGYDGGPIDAMQVSAPELEAERRGLWVLNDADGFNLLCIPPFAPGVDVDAATWQTALAYCKRRPAMLLVDAPSHWHTATDLLDSSSGIESLALRDENAALYFPRVLDKPDSTAEPTLPFVPSGAIAGVFARSDAQQGVWKAPAGTDAAIMGVEGLEHGLSDEEMGKLSRLGVNCLRTLPNGDTVIWGARTLAGADSLASEWKYVPVRRLALYLEQSIDQGTQWAVFEPNDEPLWAQLRSSVETFLHGLFRQGALQGIKADEAFFVKCGRDTMTQEDIESGRVNIQVGFAPLKPAEFIVLSITQLARQADDEP